MTSAAFRLGAGARLITRRRAKRRRRCARRACAALLAMYATSSKSDRSPDIVPLILLQGCRVRPRGGGGAGEGALRSGRGAALPAAGLPAPRRGCARRAAGGKTLCNRKPRILPESRCVHAVGWWCCASGSRCTCTSKRSRTARCRWEIALQSQTEELVGKSVCS